jgi:hypothetical protein
MYYTTRLQISEGMDRLSILQVKLSKTTDIQIKENLQEQIEILEQEISIDIGRDFAVQIYNSKEYKNLYEVNKKLFELVDLTQKDKGLAGEVNREVYNRHLAKKELQSKFSNEEYKEVKIGYEN